MWQSCLTLYASCSVQSRWADVDLLACQDRRAVVRVLLAPVDGMHQRCGAMVYRGDQLALAVGILNQAPQLGVEGPVPCNPMAACAHKPKLLANGTELRSKYTAELGSGKWKLSLCCNLASLIRLVSLRLRGCSASVRLTEV